MSALSDPLNSLTTANPNASVKATDTVAFKVPPAIVPTPGINFRRFPANDLPNLKP